MSGNQIRLANGQIWTAQQFLDHYLSPMGTPTPVVDPPAQVPVDMSWYMGEGPGRYYHPGMFKIINDLIERHDLATGSYDLADLSKSPRDRTASISHYVTDPFSSDYRTRALVFGNESARISGRMAVNADGSKTFSGIEIRPLSTDFNFEPKNAGRFLEMARAEAKKIYDPHNQGVSYDIPFSGNGRTYEPFTGSQLKAALQREAVLPGSLPPGLLPSASDSTPRYLKDFLNYLNEVNGTPATPPNDGTPEIPGNNSVSASGRGYGGQPQALPPAAAGAPASRFVSSANRNSSNSGIANWIAGMAGVDPTNPTQPAPQPVDRLRGLVTTSRCRIGRFRRRSSARTGGD